MRKIVVITGASSGFGALTARALAMVGHTVYASLRDASGRNKRQVFDAAKFSKNNSVDLRTIELDVQSNASANRLQQSTFGTGSPD
jgi:NADP-dependent 3-hydroxy acid dehydrogenase YdfG